MSDLTSLAFYLSGFSLAALCLWYGVKRNVKFFVFVSILIPALIGGLRYDVGTDYEEYVSIYEKLSSMSLSGYLALENLDIEMGFYALIKLSAFMANGPLLMMIASSLLAVWFFYLGLKRYDISHKALVYFLYLTIIFPFTFNGMRQGIAVSIVFYAFSFIIDKMPKKFIIWILAAALFHKSALFMLPFYLVSKILKRGELRPDYSLIPKLFALSTLAFAGLSLIFNILELIPFFDKYLVYQTVVAEGSNNIFYIKAAILLIALAFYRRIMVLSPLAGLFFVCLVFDVILSTLGFTSAFIKRIALYFSLFSPLLLVLLPDLFSDKLGKFVIYAILVGYGLLYFYLAYFVLQQSDIFPYRWIGA